MTYFCSNTWVQWCDTGPTFYPQTFQMVTQLPQLCNSGPPHLIFMGCKIMRYPEKKLLAVQSFI